MKIFTSNWKYRYQMKISKKYLIISCLFAIISFVSADYNNHEYVFLNDC
jgi:hypothetical protein